MTKQQAYQINTGGKKVKNNCEHLECEKINTYEGIEMKIIDINYQCRNCGKILTKDEYQEILSDNCSWCNGAGFHWDYEDKINCNCTKILEDD